MDDELRKKLLAMLVTAATHRGISTDIEQGIQEAGRQVSRSYVKFDDERHYRRLINNLHISLRLGTLSETTAPGMLTIDRIVAELYILADWKTTESAMLDEWPLIIEQLRHNVAFAVAMFTEVATKADKTPILDAINDDETPDSGMDLLNNTIQITSEKLFHAQTQHNEQGNSVSERTDDSFEVPDTGAEDSEGNRSRVKH